MGQSLFVYGFQLISLSLLGFIASVKERSSTYRKLPFLNWEILFSLFIFAFFAAVRDNVGVDYNSYLKYYESLKYGINTGFEYEKGFQIFSVFLAKSQFDFTFYFGILGLLQIFFLYYAFKYEQYLYPFLSFALLTNGTYFMWMNGIRQCIVLTIFIYSLKFIKEKDLLKYVFLILFAYFIHKSALLLLPFYFVLKQGRDYFKNIWLQLSILLLAVILCDTYIWNAFIPQLKKIVLFLGYNNYENIDQQLDSVNEHYNKKVRFYFSLLINLLIIINSKQIKKYFEFTNIKLIYNLYFCGVIFGILFYNNPLIQRAVVYLIYLQFILSAYFLYYLWVVRKSRILYLMQYYCMIFSHLCILYAYIYSNFYSHYYFIWDHNT